MTPISVLQQRIKPLEAKPAGALLLHEIYRSVQGESAFAGLPCVFVRTAVCDLRCVWCDTPHAFNQGSVWTMDDVLAKVARFETKVVEVTGGEPLVQAEVLPLLSRLADAGHTVLLETSGGRAVAEVDRRVHIIMDLKCPDSGECDSNLWQNLDHLKPADEIKFVIASKRDFDWAVDIIRARSLDKRFQILVSPAFGLVQPLDLANWLLASGLEVRLQLQLHKYIWDPAARGV